MSRFARRIYYISAFLVFAIVGPLLVAWTAGYRWTSGRSGFIRTGSLTVVSEPRATISVNGVIKGSTPFRATHLTPGTYVIELSKSGVKTWRQEIVISANVALAIGPVALYPPEFTSVDIVADGQSIVSTADVSSAYVVHATASTWIANQLWPTNTSSGIELPWQPTTVNRSHSGQTVVWQNETQAIVTIKNQPGAPWVIAPTQEIVFDPASEAIFYGRQADAIVRYDSFTRERTEVATGTSFTVINDTLWLTQQTTDSTTFLRKPVYGQQLPNIIVSIPGSWVVVQGPPGIMFIHNTVTRELATMNQSFASEQFTTSTLGHADHWWWTDANQPPLWLDGSDLFTLNEKKEAQLVDRLIDTPTSVAWIIPRHILWTTSSQRLLISSVSSRQGRGSLLEKKLAPGSSIVGLDINNHAALIQSSQTPLQLSEIHW